MISDNFEIEKEDCIACKCGNKYHISVFPVWRIMDLKIKRLEQMIKTIHEIIKIV